MNLLTLGALHSLVKDRLRNSTITYLYNEYRNRRIDEHTLEIMVSIPPELRRPILHTFRAHVTKEKALFAYSPAMTFLESEYQARSLAASNSQAATTRSSAAWPGGCSRPSKSTHAPRTRG